MSKIEVDAIEPQSGTSLTVGASGDTITIPSGATFDSSAATTTLPSTVVTTTGTQTLTNKSIATTQLTGTVATSNLGTGTASGTTFLAGDQTYKEAGGGSWVKISTTTASNTSRISFDNLASTYQMYAIKGSQIRPDTDSVTFNMNFGPGGGTYAANKTSLYWMQYNNAADSDPQAEASAGYSLGSATGDQVIGYGLSNDSTTGKAGTLQVILGGLGQDSDYGSFTANYNYYSSNTYVYATNVTGQIVTTADSVTFAMSSGNIATGEFTLYGIDQ